MVAELGRSLVDAGRRPVERPLCSLRTAAGNVGRAVQRRAQPGESAGVASSTDASDLLPHAIVRTRMRAHHSMLALSAEAAPVLPPLTDAARSAVGRDHERPA